MDCAPLQLVGMDFTTYIQAESGHLFMFDILRLMQKNICLFAASSSDAIVNFFDCEVQVFMWHNECRAAS